MQILVPRLWHEPSRPTVDEDGLLDGRQHQEQHHNAREPQSESTVRRGAEFEALQVILHALARESLFDQLLHQDGVAVLAHRASDDLHAAVEQLEVLGETLAFTHMIEKQLLTET